MLGAGIAETGVPTMRWVPHGGGAGACEGAGAPRTHMTESFSQSYTSKGGKSGKSEGKKWILIPQYELLGRAILNFCGFLLFSQFWETIILAGPGFAPNYMEYPFWSRICSHQVDAFL